jgi:23S rRNA (adenine2030-N6)-methyltransferase
MNYRHIYHAGNFADVFKHAVLALMLERLRVKPTPFFVFDSHAGLGRYDLASEPALKTSEWEGGVVRMLAAVARGAAPSGLQGYLAALAALNGGESGALGDRIRWYPGSPWLTRSLMRPGDRLVLAEAHPEDALSLSRLFAGDSQVAVHRQDGYGGLKAYLPPRERRGLVLIDPPYEDGDEAARSVAGLAVAHRRWATGIYALWYPIKERAWVWRLHEALIATGIPRMLAFELTLWPEGDWRRLGGCGMVVINPPWQLDSALAELLPWLHGALGTGAGGVRMEWLASEAGPKV